MQESSHESTKIDAFILEFIDSVPHLEALLLLWRETPKMYSAAALSQRLWVKPDVARSLLQDLARLGLVSSGPEREEYCYELNPDLDRLLGALDDLYKREMVRISTMIHTKPSSAVRDFARAFRIKKEHE